MLHERILMASPNHTSNAGGTSTHVVVFESRRQAILKPFGAQLPNVCHHYGQDPLETLTHEVAAWRLAHALGGSWEQIVPTAVLREVPGIGPGVLVNWRDGSPDLAVLDEAKEQANAAALWDALIGQQDRHLKNFRYDKLSRRLAAIDNAFAFARPGDLLNESLFLRFRRSKHGAMLTGREKEALSALLDTGDLHGLRAFLADERADALEARAQEMMERGVLPLPGVF